jgi:bifunctional non-homologous end joining protein LigD
MNAPRNISLELRNDRHSKVYNIQLEAAKGAPGLFVVNFQYGAIGATLNTGSKTKVPVEYDAATRIFERLIAEKSRACDCCGSAYVQVGSTAVAVSNPMKKAPASEPVHFPSRQSFTPELLEPLDISPTSTEPDRYTRNDSFGAQRKYDGVRLAVDYRSPSDFGGFNRKGEPVSIPEPVLAHLRKINTPMMLDGEWIAASGRYVAFDLLSMFADDTRTRPYSERYQLLTVALRTGSAPAFTANSGPDAAVIIAPLYLGTKEKTQALASEIATQGEGLVYKKLSAPYMPGRRGVNVKRKLWKSATVRICAKVKDDGKNSFAVEVQTAPGKWYNVGTVTCTKSATLPMIGTFRECRYLYLGVGNRLYQPIDCGQRFDVDNSDCSFDQLKKKQSVELQVA